MVADLSFSQVSRYQIDALMFLPGLEESMTTEMRVLTPQVLTSRHRNYVATICCRAGSDVSQLWSLRVPVGLARGVTLGNLLNLSVLQFSHQ